MLPSRHSNVSPMLTGSHVAYPIVDAALEPRSTLERAGGRPLRPEAAYPERVARWTETWLSGIGSTGLDAEQGDWPGEKLGLPETGVGSAAGGGQRLLAFLADLLAAAMITTLFVRPEFANPDVMLRFNWSSVGVWAALTIPSAAFLSMTPGMALVGVRVGRLDGAVMVGLPRALARCVLTALLVPPAVRNADGRGLHDRLTGTVVVRQRP